MNLSIKGIQKTSLIDYPGKVASILFLGGCNFLCPYCQNPDLVLPKDDFPDIPPEEILSFLSGRKEWLDGVCISGGEPTLYEDLPYFCAQLKKEGFLVKLDTNGYKPEVIDRLLKDELVDYIAIDIKHTPNKYYCAIGKEKKENNSIVREINKTRALLEKSRCEYEFRTTILPDIHTEEDILDLAKWLQGSPLFYLQQFRPGRTLDDRFAEAKTFSHEEMNSLQEKIKPYFKKCDIRLFL